MDEYIKREYAVDAVLDVYYDTPDIDLSGEKFEAAILKIQAADVAPVRHGRWVDRIVDENEVIQPWMKRYYCSECLEGGNQSWFKFCPNCGAKMDGCADGES